jgi:2-(1,2-epoxy-1,2-dihydrophenyl)acetyl-CoA isomerase
MKPPTADGKVSELKSDRQGAVLTLTLNRPDALNALTPSLLSTLSKALRDAGKDAEVRALVLTGAGRAFCAGADLSAVPASKDSLGQILRDKFNPVILQLRRLEKPVVAAVNGVAAGAGASLAFACDLQVAAEDAKFPLAFTKVGLTPDSGMSFFLTRALGISRALEAAWLGEPISAKLAHEAGLVNRLAPAGKALELAQELAAKLTELPARSVSLTKRSFQRSAERQLEAQLDYEAYLQEILGRTDDFKEGVAAFKEKRPPKFTGA